MFDVEPVLQVIAVVMVVIDRSMPTQTIKSDSKVTGITKFVLQVIGLNDDMRTQNSIHLFNVTWNDLAGAFPRQAGARLG